MTQAGRQHLPPAEERLCSCHGAAPRPRSRVYARSGLELLHRATLAGWVGKASFHLAPVVDRLAEHLKRSSKLFLDETTAPVLDPGRGRTRTGYLWALARDERRWGGAEGGRAWGRIASLIETAKMNGVEPFAYLASTPHRPRQRPPAKPHRRPPPMGIPPVVNLKSEGPSGTAYN